MKELITFEDFNNINWFNKYRINEINTIKDLFLKFPENNFINLAIFQFDLFEYEDCDDYHYIINKLMNKVINRYPDFKIDKVNCLKKNKIELIINAKKNKKAFRVNGSRFDIEAVIDFLNSILSKSNIEERFYLLDSPGDIKYPILTTPQLIEKAKMNNLIAIEY